ncbi:hypothetical protein [Burkholderia phage vB_BglM_WTB]
MTLAPKNQRKKASRVINSWGNKGKRPCYRSIRRAIRHLAQAGERYPFRYNELRKTRRNLNLYIEEKAEELSRQVWTPQTDRTPRPEHYRR